jgi:hypothetical protein
MHARLRFALAATFALTSTALARAASAQTLAFSEDWETDASRWRAVDTNPIALERDATSAVCSSRFQRETVRIGGGRVFVRAGIAVHGGGRYCLTAWVRGSAGTQPFMGINLSDAAGAPGAEHWLIGRAPYGTNYTGLGVVDAPSDAAWHWLAAPFTVEATAQFVVIKNELFSAGAAGTADFDEIQLWEGACPSAPRGAAHAACGTATPVCTPLGACVQCAASSDCRAPTPLCDTARSVCVGCRADTDCSGSTRFCDAARSVCVACRRAADCGGATPVCDATRSVCVACRSDGDCGGATPACLASGACGQCSSTNTSQCTGDRGVCDAMTNTCAQCASGDVRACSASGAGAACVMGACGCATDADCGAAGSGRVCDAMTRRCVAGCSPAMGRNGCPDGQFCTSDDTTGTRVGACTATCNFDGDCARAMADRPLCVTGDAGANRCGECRADADCAGRSGGRTRCDAETNACVECTSSRLDACSAMGRGAACVMGVCGCATDAQCGGAGSGRVCDIATNACVPGCRAGDDTCPSGSRCVGATSSATGRCEAVPDAETDVAGDTGDDATADVTLDDVARDVTTDANVDVAPDAATDAAKVEDVAGDAAQDLGVRDAALTSGAANDGCGCTAPGRASGGARGLWLALAAVFAVRRRRAKRGSRSLALP